MKLALFGRKTDISNLKKLNSIINRLIANENVELCFYAPFYEALAESGMARCEFPVFNSHEDLPDDTNLFLSLGGDGTFLESITFIRGRAIPVAGINAGRLGFLTTAQIDDDNSWIDKLLSGNYKVDERCILSFESDREDVVPADFYKCALNEITLQRRSPVMLEISITVDGRPLPVYIADGILIGSATGSTAYSLSIGGPIVTPDSKVLIIAPIAPHNLNVRPLVVPDSTHITLRMHSRDENVIFTADNRTVQIPAETEVKIAVAQFSLKRVRLNISNFIDALTEKLFWGEDVRNIK